MIQRVDHYLAKDCSCDLEVNHSQQPKALEESLISKGRVTWNVIPNSTLEIQAYDSVIN